MNPYSNLGKPFLGSWIPANSQSVNYPTNHLTTPIERPKNAAAFKFPDFPTSASSDTSSLARPPPSYESYIHPIKRVRHTPQEYSEVHREVLTLPNQVRNGGRREDQLHTQLQPGSKGLDDSFLPQHGGVRKAQNNLGLGLQESSTFGGGSNSSNPLLMKQQLDKSKKELGLGEMHGQLPFNFQNESLYTPVAHNYELANLLMSSYPNNLQVLNLLQQQLQAKQAMQQLNNYVQLNQLLYGQQDAIKGNSFIRGNQADPNNSLLRIPPLDQQSFLNYITASGGQNGLGSLFRQDKLNMSNGVSDGKKNLVQNSGLEKKEEETYSRLNKKEDLKLEEMSRLGLKAEDQMAVDLQGKEPPIIIRDEDDQDILAQRKKNNHLQQRATNMALLVKEQKDRRKNKWQMMLEQEGGVDPENPMKLSPFDKLGKSGKLSRSEKRAADLAAFKPTDIENYEDLQGNLSGGMRLGTSSQRKKKESFSRGNGKMKNSQGKNQSLLESQLYQDDKGMNHFSITSSYGRTMEEVTMDENDQKTIDTRFGDDYQAQIVDLDLGSNNVMYKRVPKLAWDPEMVDGKALEQYFEKLQAILNCKGINEEKAIKMLVKKNMIQDEVIVTIKKNEKFYSSFLGASHADKHVKHKKGR